MGGMAPPLPIVPSQSGAPRATGVLAQSGHSIDPSGSINAFMNNFLMMKNAEKSMHAQKFQEGMAQVSAGIPGLDYKAIMQHGRKAGYDWLPTEAPSEQEQASQKMYQQQQQADQAAGQAAGNAPDPMSQLMLQGQAQQQAPPQQPAPQPQPKQNLLQRLGQGLGITQPPASMQSPMAQYMQQLNQAGQTAGGVPGQLGRQNALAAIKDHLTGMSMGQQGKVLDMAGNVISHGPNYLSDMETLDRMGVLKELPIDDAVTVASYMNPQMPVDQIKQNAGYMHMYGMMGGPQMRTAMISQAGELMKAGNFDDLGQALQYVNGVFTGTPTGLTPHMTPQQLEQYGNYKKQIYDAYPTAPENVVDAYAHSQLVGDKNIQSLLKPALSSYVRNGTQAHQQFQETNKLDWAQLAQKTSNEAGLLNLGIATELGKNSQEAYDNWAKIAADPNSTHDQYNAAVEGMANSLGQQNSIKMKYNGQEFTLGGQDVQTMKNWRPSFMFSGGKSFLAPGGMSQSQLNPMTGGGQSPLAAQSSASGSDAMTQKVQQYAALVSKMPDGPQRAQAFNQIVQTLQSVPPPMRQVLLQKIDLPVDMKIMLLDTNSGSEFAQSSSMPVIK